MIRNPQKLVPVSVQGGGSGLGLDPENQNFKNRIRILLALETIQTFNFFSYRSDCLRNLYVHLIFLLLKKWYSYFYL